MTFSSWSRSLRGRLLATKPFEMMKSEMDNSEMKRTLSAKDVVAIGIGKIVGAGIFVVSGEAAAHHAGPAVILSFIVAAFTCGCAGFCYAEMATTVPVSGSAYIYLVATVGEVVAWIVGWSLILEYVMGSATVAAKWAGYLQKLIPAIPDYLINSPWVFDEGDIPGYGNVPAMILVAFLTTALCFGLKKSAWLNHTFVAIKIIVILIFLFATFGYIQPAKLNPFVPPADPNKAGKYGFLGVLFGARKVFFAYIGFDSVSACAQETRRPSRDMPIGILGSLTICTLMYILVSLNLTGIRDYWLLGTKAPLADAVADLGMVWLETGIAVGAIAGLTSVVIVDLMAMPRVFLAMARDGLLPPIFTRLHPVHGTPIFTTLLCGIATILLSGFVPPSVLLDSTAMGTLLAFMLVSLSVPILRHTRPDLHRPFQVPLGPYIFPALGATTTIVLLFMAEWQNMMRMFIWIGLGLLVYFSYGFRHSKLHHLKHMESDEKMMMAQKEIEQDSRDNKIDA